ncbi:MAG: biotin synthase BioB, partial [Nitrosopumilaceae archaeon]
MNSEQSLITICKERVVSGEKITSNEAVSLINISDESLPFLSDAANEITRKFNGNIVDVETLINAKKGT